MHAHAPLPCRSVRPPNIPAVSLDVMPYKLATGNSSRWTQPTTHQQQGVLFDPFSLHSYTVPLSLPSLTGPPEVYKHGTSRCYANLRVQHGQIALPTMKLYWPLAYPLCRYR